MAEALSLEGTVVRAVRRYGRSGGVHRTGVPVAGPPGTVRRCPFRYVPARPTGIPPVPAYRYAGGAVPVRVWAGVPVRTAAPGTGLGGMAYWYGTRGLVWHAYRSFGSSARTGGCAGGCTGGQYGGM